MKVSEAIEAIESFYVPGSIEFYARQKYNPWQKANDLLESHLGKGQIDLTEPLTKWVETCRDLTEKYKSIGEPVNEVSFLDAFMSGSYEGFRKMESNIKNICYRCSAKENLMLKSEAGKVFVSCKACIKYT